MVGSRELPPFPIAHSVRRIKPETKGELDEG